MGCSSLQSETWHCRIFRKLAYMKKLLAVLIAGSFAAGAFAQAAAPAQPATPAAPAAAPHTAANLLICSTAAAKMPSHAQACQVARQANRTAKPLYAGLTAKPAERKVLQALHSDRLRAPICDSDLHRNPRGLL
jgi:invasion protein IalB